MLVRGFAYLGLWRQAHYNRRSSVVEKDSTPYGGWDARERRTGISKSLSGCALSDATLSHRADCAGGFTASRQDQAFNTEASEELRNQARTPGCGELQANTVRHLNVPARTSKGIIVFPQSAFPFGGTTPVRGRDCPACW